MVGMEEALQAALAILRRAALEVRLDRRRSVSRLQILQAKPATLEPYQARAARAAMP